MYFCVFLLNDPSISPSAFILIADQTILTCKAQPTFKQQLLTVVKIKMAASQPHRQFKWLKI